MDFQGTYEHSLDAKYRLTIPADFREHLRRAGVVLAKGIEPCVTVWDPEGFSDYCATALEGIPRLSSKRRDLQRYFMSNSFRSELDSAGRVIVPERLRTHASIAKEVTVAGAGECLEIWERGAWAAKSAALDTSMPELTELFG